MKRAFVEAIVMYSLVRIGNVLYDLITVKFVDESAALFQITLPRQQNHQILGNSFRGSLCFTDSCHSASSSVRVCIYAPACYACVFMHVYLLCASVVMRLYLSSVYPSACIC